MQANGKGIPDDIIKITTEGRKKFAFDSLIIEVDVVAATNQYAGMIREFHDETNRIPPANQEAANNAAHNFVRGLVQAAAMSNNDAEQSLMAQEISNRMSLTTALAFIAHVHKEAEKLQVFFKLDTPAAPSSAPSIKSHYSE